MERPTPPALFGGRFVVIEGIDGSGTTTQAELLADTLRGRGYPVVLTREPTAGPIGRLLRDVLTRSLREQDREVVLDWTTLALLFAADRMDHVRRQIEPALLSGAIVISDRYDLSSLLYQSETAPEPAAALEWLKQLNSQAPRPDLTLVLHLEPEVAAARRAARGGAEELFEKQALQERLARRYAQAAGVLPGDRLRVLEADQERAQLADEILHHVEGLFVGGRDG